MKITYGIKDNVIDVTKLCKERLLTKNNIIVIPSGDGNRVKHFTDPIYGIKKNIYWKWWNYYRIWRQSTNRN